jgi:hypothetical protein
MNNGDGDHDARVDEITFTGRTLATVSVTLCLQR